VYVLNRGGRRSGPIRITTVASQASVSGVFPHEPRPGELVLLSGKALGAVKSVTLALLPRSEQPASTRYVADALLAESPQPLSIGQRAENALTVKLPVLGGFSGPIKAALTIAGTGKAVVVPITIRPEIVQVSYRLAPTVAHLQKAGEDQVTTADQKLPAPWWVAVSHEPSGWGSAGGDDVFTLAPRRIATELGWKHVTTDLQVWSPAAQAALVQGAVLDPRTGKPVPVGFDAATGELTVAVHWSTDLVPGGPVPLGAVAYRLAAKFAGPRGVPLLVNAEGKPEYVPANEDVVY
jgi:hypothetical protein